MKYFEAFGESGYQSAFMTTYAFGALAFEDIPFPKLRAAGCRNILVLVDRQMLNQALSEFDPPKFAGSSYHVIKVDAPRAFHPKITMLIGPTKGRLILGSANLTALIDLHRGERAFEAALRYAQALVAHDPWREDAIRHVMSLRYEMGDRAGAIDEYERFAARLDAEIRVAPMPETIAAYDAIVAVARRRPDASPESQKTSPGADRWTIMPLCGRERELRWLHERWSRAVRGAGGTMLIGVTV